MESNTCETHYGGVTVNSLSKTSESAFDFAGGTVALDFVNTLHWRTSKPRETLREYSDILRFSRSAGVLSKTDESRLKLAARRHPAAARRAFLKIRALREKLYSIFFAVGRGRRPSAADMEAFNKALGGAMGFRSIVAGVDFSWRWGGPADLLEKVVWPILLASGELLVSEGRHRIKICRGDGCGFLIYDKSKNRSRRWCAMQPCGNRVKVRRYQSRQRHSRIVGADFHE